MSPIAKHPPLLTESQKLTLQKISSLNFSVFNEDDVCDEFLVPLISILGYERDSDYQVRRQQSYQLNPLFLNVGSNRTKLDYQFNVYKSGFWLLEAKAGACFDPTSPPSITADMIGQAHFYSHHREIDCPYYGVSNGWWINLYDRDAEDPIIPILSIKSTELGSRFDELRMLIDSTQVTFALKRRLLMRIEQVLSADVDLSRSDEFLREAAVAAQRARPKVLENFRKNAKIQQEEHAETLRRYLEDSRPFDVIETILMSSLNWGTLGKIVEVVARKVAEYPGSNQHLFFHKLLVTEPRAVTTHYYLNALLLLGALCQIPDLQNVDYPSANGKRETPIVTLFAEFAELLLFQLSDRPELRVVWAMEALITRMTKRMLLSNDATRAAILNAVNLERYFRPEESIAYLGPSPARTTIQVIEGVTIAGIGTFFQRHYRRPEQREFDITGALAEYESLRTKVEPFELSSDEAYVSLKKNIGQDWSELTGADIANRNWDRLGQGVCDVLLLNKNLLPHLSDIAQQRIGELARLGNSFARKCVISLGLNIPEGNFPDMEAKLKIVFNPSKKLRDR